MLCLGLGTKTTWFRVRKTSCFGLRYPVTVTTIMDEHSPTSGEAGFGLHKKTAGNIQWCDLNCSRLVCLLSVSLRLH